MPKRAKKREAPKAPPEKLVGWQQIAAFLGEASVRGPAMGVGWNAGSSARPLR